MIFLSCYLIDKCLFYEALRFSPGSFTVKHADRKMLKKESNSEKYCSKEFKKRRVELKKSASTAASPSETNRSGVYSTTISITASDMETIQPTPEQLQQTPLPPY